MSPGPLIAEFTSERDAQLFAGLKREIGEPVCVTAGIHQVYGVRVCSDALIDQLFGEGFRQLEGSP